MKLPCVLQGGAAEVHRSDVNVEMVPSGGTTLQHQLCNTNSVEALLLAVFPERALLARNGPARPAFAPAFLGSRDGEASSNDGVC